MGGAGADDLIYCVLAFSNRYMILAPAAMTAEKDPKKAAQKCFDGIQLDPDNFRIGHTKVRFHFILSFTISIAVFFFS